MFVGLVVCGPSRKLSPSSRYGATRLPAEQPVATKQLFQRMSCRVFPSWPNISESTMTSLKQAKAINVWCMFGDGSWRTSASAFASCNFTSHLMGRDLKLPHVFFWSHVRSQSYMELVGEVCSLASSSCGPPRPELGLLLAPLVVGMCSLWWFFSPCP